MPDNVIEEYGLQEKATADGYVYVVVSKGVYGLPQAEIIAQPTAVRRKVKQGWIFSDQIYPRFMVPRMAPRPV